MRSLSIFVSNGGTEGDGRLHVLAGEETGQRRSVDRNKNVDFKYRLLMTVRWKRFEGE